MIQIKPKKCKGTGKAKGHGCGSVQLKRRYGLGFVCGCFAKWLSETPAGKETLQKSTLKAKKKVREKKKKEERKRKESYIDYKLKLQTKINEIVRLIDYGQPCLARRIIPNQIHAGHVFSRGSHPSMKFNLHNIHRQSAQSNHYQNEDGLFRDGLKKEYGLKYYEFLNSMRSLPALKFSNQEYKNFYKKACKIASLMKKEAEIYTTPLERINKRNEVNKELSIYDEFIIFTNN